MALNIPVGISACLLGENVRYNGGHKRSRTALNLLNNVFSYTGYCPEVAIGLGVPRQTIRINEIDGQHRVVNPKEVEADHTDALYEYGLQIGKESLDLSGYILMKNSPSCGLYSAKVYRKDHPLPGKYEGLFVRGLKEVNALIPLEEEGRLNDPVLRENFVAAVFAWHDWRIQEKEGVSAKQLIRFHSRYKYLVMAHSQKDYKVLGHLLSDLKSCDITEVSNIYIETFMTAIKKPVSRKGHVNVLYHILGYLRGEADGAIRQDIADIINEYRLGHINLSVPATLLNHYLKRFGSDYIKEQVYLNPYSEKLGLRNTI